MALEKLNEPFLGLGRLGMNVHERIEGAQKLIAVFGYWPSFHDAEVLWLRMDRRPVREDVYGPTLEMMVHTFEITSEVGPDGAYVLRHHVLVHLRFQFVNLMKLKDFNHQNDLYGIHFKDIRANQWELADFEITLEGDWGLDGSFLCKAVEVVDVTPCDKTGEPLPIEYGK
jgi:hypothetical protein